MSSWKSWNKVLELLYFLLIFDILVFNLQGRKISKNFCSNHSSKALSIGLHPLNSCIKLFGLVYNRLTLHFQIEKTMLDFYHWTKVFNETLKNLLPYKYFMKLSQNLISYLIFYSRSLGEPSNFFHFVSWNFFKKVTWV